MMSQERLLKKLLSQSLLYIERQSLILVFNKNSTSQKLPVRKWHVVEEHKLLFIKQLGMVWNTDRRKTEFPLKAKLSPLLSMLNSTLRTGGRWCYPLTE